MMFRFPLLVICCGDVGTTKKMFSVQNDDNVFVPVFNDGEKAAKFKAWAAKAYDDELRFSMVEGVRPALELFEVITINVPTALVAIDPEPGSDWNCESIGDVIDWLRNHTSP